jgi:hypothetical protein
VDATKNVAVLEAEVERLASYTEGRNYPLEVLNLLAQALPKNNGELVVISAEQAKKLKRGKSGPVRTVIEELSAGMSLRNERKVWVLDLRLDAVSFLVGRVARGSTVTLPTGAKVSPEDGVLKLLWEGPVEAVPRLPVEDSEGYERLEDFALVPGVRVGLTVALSPREDDVKTLEAIQDGIFAQIRERIPNAVMEGAPTTVYGLTAEAVTPANKGGFGEAVRQFRSQRIRIDYPDPATLLVELPE